MKLTKDLLLNYFTIADPNNSHYSVATNTFDFVNRNSNTLLVTIGDSWTWGSDLTLNDDEEFRLDHVYGNIIADQLTADWLNLGQPGSNNFFIAEKTEELGQLISTLSYKKIYLICTFTEIGRSFNSHHDQYIDYMSWFNQTEIINKSDFYKFFDFLNSECLKRIRSVVNTYNLELIIGTNFVDAIGINHDAGFLPMPWFRLLNIDCPITAYAGTTGVQKLETMLQFIPNRLTSLFRLWFIDLVNQADCIDKAALSPTLIKQHPRQSGHESWANYILESIK